VTASAERRFIVLARPRTGSSLLQRMLDSHADIRCEEEVLNPDFGYFPRTLLELSRVLPYPFLYWRWRRNRRCVYGCKVMVYEVRELRAFLRKLVRRGWRIIHLERQDLIASVISDLLARKRGVWHREAGLAAPDAVTLDVEEFRRFVGYHLRWRRREREAVADLPHLHLTYEEDLLGEASLRRTSERMLDHLGLPVQPLSAGLIRTDDRATDKVVINLRELLDSLQGTRGEALLEHFQPVRAEGRG
jgi:LPS sulfotransferase NodH